MVCWLGVLLGLQKSATLEGLGRVSGGCYKAVYGCIVVIGSFQKFREMKVPQGSGSRV